MGPAKHQSRRGESREGKQLCPCRELNPRTAVYGLVPILSYTSVSQQIEYVICS
jgi:hypothetical protein